MNVQDIRSKFKELLKNEDYTIDKTGVKTLELIGVSFLADEEVIFGTLNKDYAERELQWYKSMSLSVDDIPGGAPTIWKNVSSSKGLINSNYGWCIWSDENFNQYLNCLNELKNNPDSRRAVMIYTRPTMYLDYNKDGMSDFICTNNVACYIRNNKLQYVINQRSCDVVFGYKNDRYWHNYVHNRLLDDLKVTYPDLELGDLIHQVQSLHIYERHFKFIV